MDLSYLLPPLIVAIIAAVLLVVILVKVRLKGASRIFSINVFATSLWGLFIFLMRNSPDVDHALLWERALIPVIFMFFVSFYHFSLVITNTTGNRRILKIVYICGIPIVATSFTPWFFKEVVEESYGYAPIFGLAGYIIFGLTGILLIMAFSHLIRAYKLSKEYEEKNRYMVVLLAMLLPLAGLIIDVFPTIYPASIFGALAFCLLASVAIFRYHLFDIHFIVRQSSALVVLSALVSLPYLGIILMISKVISPDKVPLWVHAILLLLIAFAFPRLLITVRRMIDQVYYRKRYGPIETLENFSRVCTEIVDLDILSDKLISTAVNAMEASSAHLMVRSKNRTGFRLISSTAMDKANSILLDADSLIVRWLKSHDYPLRIVNLDYDSSLTGVTQSERQLLLDMDAYLLVPFKQGENLNAVLVMGAKGSGEPYGADDVILLMVLARHAGVALENASLYAQAIYSERVLKQYQHDLRKMVVRLEDAEEKERECLARELHDQVGQNLTALGLNLNIIKNQLDGAVEPVRKRLEGSMELLEQTTRIIRNLMGDLLPPMLNDYGLVAALRWQGERLASQTNLNIKVLGEDIDPRLPQRVEIGLFRIAQEALTNVMKHAQPSNVIISAGTSDGSFRLTIADDGIGFDLRQPGKTEPFGHYGLLSMTERAQSFNGTLRLESKPGEGTRVIVEVPV